MADVQGAFGRSVLRVDGPPKLTGSVLYAGDFLLPGMLHLRALRSDRPHARILAIRTERAKAHPGVVAVLTHEDIPGTNRVGPREKDQPVLCDKKVLYVGDPVALVAAESPQDAEEALSLIQVDYEDLPGVFSPEDALTPGAPKIHDSPNLLLERVLVRGDPDQALQEADLVITNTYRTQMVEHGYLEPEAGVALYEEGKVTVWMPSKHAHFDHREMAGVLGLAPEKVRVILTTIGGSFGDKQCLAPGYYSALASLKTGRPCKMVYGREESFFASTKRHPFLIHYTTGVSKDGRLLAVKVEIVADTGAYTSYGPSILVRGLVHASGPYEIPNVYVRARAVFTNNPVAGAMRGFGVPQVVLAHESQLDIVAERLHIDPIEIRIKNGVKAGSLLATGQRLNASVGYRETLEDVKREITRRGVPVSFGSKRYGWGVASMFYGIGLTGLPNPGFARIEAAQSGGFTLFMGCGDMGQGSATTMAQIASEVLGTGPEKIHLVIGDTELCPDSGTSTASRVTYVVGRSVQLASESLRDLLRKTAGEVLGVAAEDMVLDEEFLYPTERPGRRISLSEAIGKLREKGIAPAGEGTFNPETSPLDPKTGQGSPYGTYAFAAQAALVSVDTDTGEVEVIELVASHDVGKAVNPRSVIAQVEGGVSMGIGYGLMEEVTVKEGVIRNPRFSEYFIPTALDLPEVTSLVVESEEPTGPFGAKGVGEPALLPTAPAILNAIAAATGTRPKEIPVTSERLWELLKRDREEQKGAGV